MPPRRLVSRIFPAPWRLGLLALAALPLRAQTVDYPDTSVDPTPRTTTTGSPLTLNVGSGAATQGGLIDGDGSITKTGAGTLTLAGANTFSGGTVLDGGTLVLTDAAALGTGGVTFSSLDFSTLTAATDVTLAAPVTLSGRQSDALVANNGVTFRLAGAFANDGWVYLSGAGTFVFSGDSSGRAVNFMSGSPLVLDNPTPGFLGTGDLYGGTLRAARDVSLANTLHSNPTIDTNGFTVTLTGKWPATAITKTGAGTLVLAGDNSAGTTHLFIAAGTLALDNPVVNAVGGSGSQINFTGNATLQARQDITFSQTIDLGANTVTLDTDGHSFLLDIPGTISGTGGALIKTGAGTLTLLATGSYTGGTTIAAGILQIGNGGPLSGGTAGGDFIDNASLVFNPFSASTSTGTISGTGTVTKLGAGNLTLSGVNSYAGGTTVSAGTLTLGSLSALGSGTVSVGPGATLDSAGYGFDLTRVSGAGTLTGTGTFTHAAAGATDLATILAGTASLAKSGGGTLSLSGANTYTGTTTVSAGTLIVNGSLANTATRVESGATLGGRGTIGGLTTIANGAHLAPGNSPGTITFTDGLALDAGSALDFQLGTVSDLIRVSGGTLTGPSSGQVTLNLADAGGFAPATYVLLDFNGASLSDFDAADFTLGTTIAGYDYAFNLAGSTLELVATASAIPEPSTFAALLGIAALGLAAGRRRALRPAQA